jgi:monoamine oxidase
VALEPRFIGCMDGAIRSGERAAQEILAARRERKKVGAA